MADSRMNLRALVLRGGVYLTGRSALGLVLGLVSTILITRTIGPVAYGLYVTVYGIFFYLNQLSSLGIGVFLVRKEGEIQEEHYHQAFSFLLILGCCVAAMAILCIPFLDRWVKLDGFPTIAAVFFIGLPLYLAGVTPLARLERHLDFRRVALIELSNQLVYLLVAVPLAFRGLGAWAPVAGFWVAQTVCLVLLFLLSAYRPRFSWNWQAVRKMTSYGLGYSSSTWVWQLRTLVNPLVISRFLGAEYVAFVAIADKLVNMLSFVKNAAWRLSIAALARLQGDPMRLSQAISEGMQWQVMALGPILISFVWVAPWLLPLVYGDKWLPVLVVLPYIALGNLANAMFNMHSSALYVLKENLQVTKFHLVHIILFASGAVFLVNYFGLLGYGLAEMVALPGYVFIHLYALQKIGKLSYTKAMVWFFPFSLALFVNELGWWVGPLILAPLLWKESRIDIVNLWRSVRS